MSLFVHRIVNTSLLLVLSACQTNWGLNLPINNSNSVPDVNLKGDERLRYDEDVAYCQKQIRKQYGDNYASNNAIIGLRLCLIEKGYVLLS